MRDLTKSEEIRTKLMQIFLGEVTPTQPELSNGDLRGKLRKLEDGRLHSLAAYCHTSMKELIGEDREAWSRMTVAELANIYAEIEGPEFFEKFPVKK